MIVIRVLGTDKKTSERKMRKITRTLMDYCKDLWHENIYVEFPQDRMRLDLGVEIVIQIFTSFTDMDGRILERGVRLRVRDYCPAPVKIGVQRIEALTSFELS